MINENMDRKKKKQAGKILNYFIAAFHIAGYNEHHNDHPTQAMKGLLFRLRVFILPGFIPKFTGKLQKISATK